MLGSTAGARVETDIIQPSEGCVPGSIPGGRAKSSVPLRAVALSLAPCFYRTGLNFSRKLPLTGKPRSRGLTIAGFALMTTTPPGNKPLAAAPGGNASPSPRVGRNLATSRRPQADYDGDARKLVEMVASFLGGLSPNARALWSDEQCTQIAGVLKLVMEKHQWTLEDLSPELKLLLVAGPTLLASLNRPTPVEEAQAAPQYNRRSDDPKPERRQQVDRRSGSTDRRVTSTHNLIRPFRWNQFKG